MRPPELAPEDKCISRTRPQTQSMVYNLLPLLQKVPVKAKIACVATPAVLGISVRIA